jgi:hypothetical protein
MRKLMIGLISVAIVLSFTVIKDSSRLFPISEKSVDVIQKLVSTRVPRIDFVSTRVPRIEVYETSLMNGLHGLA